MPDKEKRITAARAWLNNAGLYVEDAESVLDELFTHHGLLEPWSDDAKLQADVIRAWEGMRPRAIKAEADQRAYQLRACRSPAWLRKRKDALDTQAEASPLDGREVPQREPGEL